MIKRQELFAKYYAETHNGQQSATKAGYSDRGASKAAQRLLKNVQVRSLIEKHEAEVLDRELASIRERKTILTEISRAKLKDFFDLEEQCCPHCAEPIVLGQLILEPDRLTAAVQSITKIIDKNGNVRHTIRLRDPVGAIAELNRMEGVYGHESSEGPGEITGDQILRAIQEARRREERGES